MTLVLAMHDGDNITVVADGLSRMFDPYTCAEDKPMTKTQKVIPLGKYLVMGYSNSGIAYDFMQGMLFYVKGCFKYDGCPTVKLAAAVVVTLTQKYIHTNPLSSGATFRILLAGFDRDEEGDPTKPSFYTVNHTGKWWESEKNYDAIGADAIGIPILEMLSGKRSLSLKEALEIGAETIFETAKKDSFVGGTFTHRAISKSGGFSRQIDLITYNSNMSKKLFKRLIKKASQPTPKGQDK